MKTGSNGFRGLNTDVSAESIGDGYFIDALDIRLSTDTGESNNAVTNIKGNSLYLNLANNLSTGDGVSILGTPEIIGHCTIRNRVVLFVGDDTGTNGWIISFLYDDVDKSLGTVTNHYKNPNLNFKKKHPIEALGRFESENIVRVYWSDYEEYFRSVNLFDPNLSTAPLGTIDIYPNIKYVFPKLTKVESSGNLKSGLWQYSYRLISSDGKKTFIAPPGNLIHVVSDSENENQSANYTGNEPGTTTNKSLEITIDTSMYSGFDEIELVGVFKSDYTTTHEYYSIEVKKISGLPEIVFIHNGQGEEIIITPEEFVSKQYPFKTVKTMATKDNLLILANLKESSFDIDDYLEDGEYFDALTGRYNNLGQLPDPNDMLNNAFNIEYNKDAHWDVDWHKDKQFKYRNDGVTLGGEGLNISYNFHLEPFLLDGDLQPGFSNVPNVSYNSVNLNDGVGNYSNSTYDNMASPFKSGLLRGYKRGETYRFGIVFYDLKGSASFVKFIGDIKFPDLSEEDNSNNLSGTNYFPIAKETNRSSNSVTTMGYSLGIEFTLDFSTCTSLLDKISGYQIVRVKREYDSTRRLCSGILKVASVINDSDIIEEGDPNSYAFPPYRLNTSPNANGSSSGANANFATLNNRPKEDRINLSNTADHGAILGNIINFHSPEVSYDFREDISKILDGDSYLLITGRYGQYYSNPLVINLLDPPYGSGTLFTFPDNPFSDNRSMTYVSNSVDGFGLTLDFRRKMRTTSRVNKKDPWSSGTTLSYHSYSEYERGVEYIKKWNNRDESRLVTDLGYAQSSIVNLTGVHDLSGGSSETIIIQNRYSYKYNEAGGYDSSPPSRGILNTGASGIIGFIGKVETDPLTNTPINKKSEVDHFAAGPFYNDSSGNSLVVSKRDLSGPNSKSDKEEDLTSTPLLDILLPRTKIYGGYTYQVLESNRFIPASPYIDVSNVVSNTHSFRVFGGDIFINMWTLQSQSVEGRPVMLPEPSSDPQNPFTVTAVDRFENHTETTVIPIESKINIDIDHGSTLRRGVLGGPEEVVRHRQEGRGDSDHFGNMFKGEAKTLMMYAYNDAYSQENTSNSFFIKPENFDQISKVNDIRAVISLEKFNNKDIDSWTIFPTNSFYDVDDRGPINKLISFRDEVYFFQDKGVGKYDINPRAIITAEDGVSTELGSGQGLQDHQYLTTQNGSIHQWAIQATDSGIYYWDSTHSKLFIIQEGNQPLSEVKGIHSLVNSFKGDCLLRKENGGDNPILGKGVHMGHDKVNDELFITFMGLGQQEELVSETLVYDEVRREFAGRRSARPPIYIDNGDLLLSSNPNNKNELFRHNHGNWGEFYGNVVESSITLILNADSPMNKILRTIEFNSIVRDSNKTIDRGQTITGFRIKTEYQDTNKVNFSSGRIKRKFDKWRLKIPRDQINNSGRDRLRSSYFELTLYFNNSYNKELILNTINYHYDIQIF